MFFILCMKLSIENTSEKLKVKYYYHVYFMRIWERWKEFICTSILSLGFFFFFFLNGFLCFRELNPAGLTTQEAGFHI